MSLQKKLNKSQALALMSRGAQLVHQSGVYHGYYLIHEGKIFNLNKNSVKSLFYLDTRIVCTKREGFESFYELRTKK